MYVRLLYHFLIFSNVNLILLIERKRDNQPEELQSAILDILKMPVAEIDAVDGFLKTLGEALRRLCYRKRTMLEIKFLQMTTEAEFEDNDAS